MKTTKIQKAVQKATAVDLNKVLNAGWTFASSKAEAIKAIQAAGGEKIKGVREAFCAGYIAQRLHATEKASKALFNDGYAVLKALGHNAKGTPKENQARRSKEQEQAYAAARTAWKVITKKAGIAASDNRGGARIPKLKAVESSEGAEIETTAATPQAKNKADVHQFVRQQAAMLLAYANENAKMLDLSTRAAIAEFCESINAIKD